MVSQLGETVRTLRESAELTQEQAADAAELSAKHWQDVERGNTNPTVATLVAIARALDVPLATLFKGL